MLRRLTMALAAGALLAGLTFGTALAGNPAGKGQPSAECGDEGATSEPAGFLTDGFANAETHYAGSDGTPSLANAQSTHAVSQYDVACFQVTQHH
jgi:hypothetical protein